MAARVFDHALICVQVKPLGIVAPLIQTSVPAGGIVIDPFAGSLTTGIAAQMLGRQFAAC